MLRMNFMLIFKGQHKDFQRLNIYQSLKKQIHAPYHYEGVHVTNVILLLSKIMQLKWQVQFCSASHSYVSQIEASGPLQVPDGFLDGPQ